ncbi:MAG: hypothetical protein JNM24_11470 [Bdellovibrionaceae bacterium]|nr:hypothetical protein [Pseudobdellovibrionaceae bacterium]
MSRLNEIPIVRQAKFFLQEAGSANGIKVTETGALGRNFVQALWDNYLKQSKDDIKFRPTRELESPEATRIHFLLSEFKYVKRVKSKICLTEKGKSMLEKNKLEDLYRDLFSAAIGGWNWGFEDRYPDYEFIQQAALLLIEELLETPQKAVSAIQIFEKVFHEIVPELSEYMKDELVRCLTVRFFYRFCIPFGIIKSDVGDLFLDKKPDGLFEKTEFFISVFPQIIFKQ